VLQFGVLEIRDLCIIEPAPGFENGPFEVIAGNHLSKGVFRASHQEPENAQVLQSLRAKFRVQVVNRRTPSDVLAEVRDADNILNGIGLADTYQQQIRNTVDILAEYKLHLQSLEVPPAFSDFLHTLHGLPGL
jgi:hypothetical protein